MNKIVHFFSRANGLVIIGFSMLISMVVVTLLANFIVPYDPFESTGSSLTGPSKAHWLGTDEIGRDVFSRILVGGRDTLFIIFASIGISLIVGLILGLVAGYVGGWVSQLIMRVLDVIFAFPVFLLAIAVLAGLGSSVPNLILTIAIVYSPHMARIVRAPVLSIKTWDHVEAARSIGVSHWGIVTRHILPLSFSPILIATSLNLSYATFTVTAMSFLGLGPPPPNPNWGGMLADGRQFMELAPMNVIAPAGAIVFATTTFIFIANGLRDMFDVQGVR
jgi:peptide/nickel transport system permease protein